MRSAIRRTFTGLPLLMRLGVSVFLVGAVLDVVYHGVPQAWVGGLEPYLGDDGVRAHYVTLIGMATIMAEVFLTGIRRSVDARRRGASGGESRGETGRSRP